MRVMCADLAGTQQVLESLRGMRPEIERVLADGVRATLSRRWLSNKAGGGALLAQSPLNAALTYRRFPLRVSRLPHP